MTLLYPRSGRTARRIYYTTPEQKEIAIASRDAEQKKYTKWVASENYILARLERNRLPIRRLFLLRRIWGFLLA